MLELKPGSQPPAPCVLFVNVTWCPHCTRAKPEIAKAAQMLGTAVPVVSVDGDKNPALTKALGVNGYPDILFLDNNRQLRRYEGDRRGSQIADWACQVSSRCAGRF